jgi:RND family efflux transporter MFP subunit
MPSPLRTLRTLRPLAAGLALAGALASGCGQGAAAPGREPEPPVPVRTAAVERGPIDRPVRAAGTVAAKDEWELGFKVGGVVARVAVQQGERIRRGQVLATLDATEVAAAVRQTREGLEKAERDRVRLRMLADADAAPRMAADDAETAARVARAALEAAEFNLRRATVVAPDDGWVDRRLAEPGEVVAAGRPVLHVSGGGRGFVVRAELPDRDVLGLAAGAGATVRLDARPGQPIPGTVTEIARSASRGTGTYAVEIRLDPARAPRDLLAGLTAKVEIERTVDAAAAVPIGSLVEADGPSGAVFVVEGGLARRVPVSIAFLQGERAVLAAGLDGIERVVTDGAPRLADGSPVQLAD